MTDEMSNLIEKEFNDALESKDSLRIDKAIVRYSIAMMECQKKTAERVKESQRKWDEFSQKFDNLERTVNTSIETTKQNTKDIEVLQKDVGEFKKIRERARGASWVLKLAYGAGAGGGIAVAVKILEKILG